MQQCGKHATDPDVIRLLENKFDHAQSDWRTNCNLVFKDPCLWEFTTKGRQAELRVFNNTFKWQKSLEVFNLDMDLEKGKGRNRALTKAHLPHLQRMITPKTTDQIQNSSDCIEKSSDHTKNTRPNWKQLSWKARSQKAVTCHATLKKLDHTENASNHSKNSHQKQCWSHWNQFWSQLSISTGRESHPDSTCRSTQTISRQAFF